jgi:isoamylase
VYAGEQREAQQTINFVTCHDGFTLNDLVSYDAKHNAANGEDNRDGADDNRSWNCGVEGPSDDPAVEALRARQVRNLLALALLSVGVPMLAMGDEVRRTQLGNNNAYCQDSALSWFDWTLVERHAGLLRFCRILIAARRQVQRLLDMPTGITLAELLARSRIDWHGTHLSQPDLGDQSRSIAFTIWGEEIVLHLICNAYWEALDFALPAPEPGMAGWRRYLDTTLPSPDDIVTSAAAPTVGQTYRAGPRSVVVLASARA